MFGRYSEVFEPGQDGFDDDRRRLKSALISFRERVAQLITLIPRDMPGYTVHDISHLDALWQMVETILGPEYELSPAETFVLGGSILLHDAGMTVAAFTGGREEIEKTVEFSRALAAAKARTSIRADGSVMNEDAVRSAALVDALRVLHPAQARALATLAWKSPIDGKDVFLIEDSELRAHYAATIGLIAQSHHWDQSTLQKEFTHPLGPFPSHPDSWAVDPLKIALILRCADAAHLDARRAPLLLFAANPPHGISAEHWMFQTMLARPVVREDKLLYGSTSDFGIDKADAWHLAYDTLRMVDAELGAASEANIHRGYKRFAVDGVLGAGSPEQLAHYIKASGWRPVTLNLRVSNVPHLARTLGGKDLYSFGLAPLRELIQNAADATEARAAIDQDFELANARVVVKVADDVERISLEICDEGIGMSERVLTGILLDFGFSFWKSSEAQREFPALKHDDISPRGKFGIGFFSVFMWADDVEVISRRFNDSPNDAKVLHFRSGLDTRPLLRSVYGNEVSTKWSTRIRLRIPKTKVAEIFSSPRRVSRSNHFMMPSRDEGVPRGWSESVKLLCGALPIGVQVDEFGKISQGSLPDWKVVEASQFLDFFKDIIQLSRNGDDDRFAGTLSNVKQEGVVVGRACFVPRGLSAAGGVIAIYEKGIFVGRMSATCASGVMEGRVTNAAREKFEEVDIANNIQWVQEASEKAFAMCKHPGEELGVQEALIRIGSRADTRPLFVLNRAVISVAALREYCRGATRLTLRLVENSDEFKFKETDSLSVIYGMRIDATRLYTLIDIPGSVERDTDIAKFMERDPSPLAKLFREIADSVGHDCVVRASVMKRETYQSDFMDIEFEKE